MGADLLQTIAANARARIAAKFGEDAGIGRLISAGVPNGNAQRLLGGKENYGLQTLVKVAAALDVPAWQLCTPDLGSGVHVEVWPLAPFVSREQWAELTPAQRHAAAWEAAKAVQALGGLAPQVSQPAMSDAAKNLEKILRSGDEAAIMAALEAARDSVANPPPIVRVR